MQLKIYRLLNTISIGTILLSIIIFSYFFFNRNLAVTENKRILLTIILFVINFSLILGYRYLEKNWDRKLILKMLENKEVVLAKVNHTDIVKVIRETSMKRFVIHKMYLMIYHDDLSTEDIVIYEKFNEDCTEVPEGYVYITYSTLKPGYNFVIHNDLLAHFPDLQPVTEHYEKNVLNLEYLYTYQKDGLIIEKVREYIKRTGEGVKA